MQHRRCAETAGGTVLAIKTLVHRDDACPAEPQAIGELTSGALTASDVALRRGAQLASLRRPRPQPASTASGQTASPGVAARQPGQLRVDLAAVARPRRRGQTSSRVPARMRTTTSSMPPPPGKRLVVSTNATDGQISLSLYAPQHRRIDARRRERRRRPRHARHRAERPRRPAGRVGRRRRRRRRRPDPRRPGGRPRRRHRAGRGGVDGCRSRRAAARARHERQRRAERVALLAARAVPRRSARGPLHAVRRPPRRPIPAPIGVSDPITRSDQHDLPLRPAALRRHLRRAGALERARRARHRSPAPATSATARCTARCSRSTPISAVRDARAGARRQPLLDERARERSRRRSTRS